MVLIVVVLVVVLLVVVVSMLIVVHVTVCCLLLILLSHGCGFNGVVCIIRVVGNGSHLHVNMSDLSDLIELVVVVRVVECDTGSHFAGTSSSSSSMNIAIDILWWLNLNNQTKIWNINTTRSNISCNKHLNHSLSESSQSFLS